MKTAVFGLLIVSALSAAKTLDMYVIDLEGSKSSLFVSPSGQTMVIDAGIPGSEANGRDGDASWKPVRPPVSQKIDYMVVSHYDGDHVGGVPALAARMPIGTFVDHGENVQYNDFTVKDGEGLHGRRGQGQAHGGEARRQKFPSRASTHWW